MSSIGRHESKGFAFTLLIIFGFALMNRISASDETCGEINGLCYYKAWNFRVDWDTAWQLCNSRNSTLPIIRNRNEQDAFKMFLNIHLSGSAVWTSGKNYTYDEWTWLDGRPYSGRDDKYIGRLSGNQRYHPALGYRYRFFYILDTENPRTLLRYICKYSDLCNYINNTANITNGCIRESDDRRSWYDARNQCLIAGGDLAVLDSAEIANLEYFDPSKSRSRYDGRWIGLRKTSWRWSLHQNASEDDEIKYTNWSKDWNPLIGDCISIDESNGAWRTTDCSDKRKVVCQTGLRLDSVERESQSVSYSTFIAIVIIGICIIGILIIVIIFIVRKYIYRNAHDASSSEITANRSYQDLETTRRQANPNAIYTELQTQPVYEVVCQRSK